MLQNEKYLSNLFLTYHDGNVGPVYQDIEMAFIHLPGEANKHRLIDISTRELSFVSDHNILHEGQILRNVYVHLGDGMEVNLDARVSLCKPSIDGAFSYTLNFLGIEWPVYNKIFTHIFNHSYPHLKSISNFTEAEIYNLFDRSGYLSLKSKKEMDLNFKKMVGVAGKIGERSHITKSLIYYDNGRPLTIGSALRIYDRTFMGHHLASLPEAKFNLRSKTEVYLGLMDFMDNHPYFEYYLTYFDNNLSWHDKMYKRFGVWINDKNKFYYDSLYFFEYTDEHSVHRGISDNFTCQLMDRPDEFFSFCEGNLEPIIANCYQYSQGHFNLLEVKQLYEMLDLYIARRLWKVTLGGRTVAYAVAEAYTDGLNLYNLLDMCRVYFTCDPADINPALEVLLPDVSKFYQNFGKKKFNVFFKASDQAAKTVNIPGLHFHALAGRVIVHRDAGVKEYRKLLNQLSIKHSRRNH